MKSLFIDFPTASDHMRPLSRADRRPLVGLSVNIADGISRLHQDYIEAVAAAGGVPVMIPASNDATLLGAALDAVDGLILTGGADVGGEYFGQKTLEGLTDVSAGRDAYDFILLRLASDRQLPIMGICRGMQVMNIAFGGDIWQDISSQYPGRTLPHSVDGPREKVVHQVEVTEGSILRSIMGETLSGVNSRHHQALKNIAPGFTVSAVSPDGIVEAIEDPVRRMFGVQWHPENMAIAGGDDAMKKLFRYIVGEASLFQEAREVHRNYLTVDSHCDTPMLFDEHNIDIGRRDPASQVDLVKMQEGLLDAVFVVAYIPQGALDARSHTEATAKAVSLLEQMRIQVAANEPYAGLATSFAQADILKREGRKALFLGLENGYALGTEIGNLDLFRKMGVTYITLCHNGANEICDSAVGEAIHGGLSPFGRTVVHEMNHMGLVIDLSHAAETTFYDTLAHSSAPVICSHSSARSLCDHPRNLSDRQITSLADKDGVVQVCLYDGFLAEGRQATVSDAVDHIEHIVTLVGPDHVGIGSDFDGGGGIAGCSGSNEIINITVELLRRGYPHEAIGKILGGNLRRVVDWVQTLAKL